MNVRQYRSGNKKKGKFIETGNIGEEKQRKNKTQYPSNDQTKKNKTNKKHNMC